MDGFLTAEEAAFRRAARDYFRTGGVRARPEGPEDLERIWRDLEGAGRPETVAARACRGPAGRVAVVDAAAERDPVLGRALLGWYAGSGRPGPHEGPLCGYGRVAGTAVCVFEAGSAAARAGGAFSSSLMGCREVQERLAGLVSGAAWLRLATLRVCRLLERGEPDLARAESSRLRDPALALARDVRSAALALLGEPWVEANLPPDDLPSDDERKEP